MKILISGALVLSTLLSIVSFKTYSQKNKDEYLTNSPGYISVSIRDTTGLQPEVIVKNRSGLCFSRVKVGVVLLNNQHKAVLYKIITLKQVPPHSTVSSTLDNIAGVSEIQSQVVDLDI